MSEAGKATFNAGAAFASNVGIGTNSPSQKLSIVESGGSARMELLSGTSGTSIIDMGDTSDADIGGIRYDNTNDALSFRAGNDERMNLDSGSLGIGVAASSASGRIHAEEPNNRNAAFIHATNASYGSSTLQVSTCLLYTSPSPRDGLLSRMPSSA